jgi:hypothetical protein
MKTVILYLNKLNDCVYANYTDNDVNKANKSLTRYVIPEHLLKIFVRYYGVKLHPITRNNVI